MNYYCPNLGYQYAQAPHSTIYWSTSWKTDLIGRLANIEEGIFVDSGAMLGALLDLVVRHPNARYVGFEPNVACVF